MLLSIAAVIYIPTNSAQGPRVSSPAPAFVIPCLFDDSHSDRGEAVAESTVFAVRVGTCGSCVVPGWRGAPSTPCSVGWHWDKDLHQGPQ